MVPLHRIESVRPLFVEMAELATSVALRVTLAILLPKQLQGHVLASQLLVNAGPIGQSSTDILWRRRCSPITRRSFLEELLPEALLVQPSGQRP